MARRGHTNIDSMQDESPLGLQSSFIAGLKTEFTGLNFPPNAATDTDNCVFTMLGDVTRRKGFDLEDNYATNLVSRTLDPVNTYVWRNAGGDGESVLYVAQVGLSIFFYSISTATVLQPLSTRILTSVVDLTPYLVGTHIILTECEFADGNGYLFIYNTSCDPIYCTFDPIAQTVTSAKIDVKIRDFLGYPETGKEITDRPLTLTTEHEYNLRNQGWTRAPLWNFTANDSKTDYLMGNAPGTDIPSSFTGNGRVGISVSYGNHIWSVSPGLPITVGTPVDINFSIPMNVYDIDAIAWHQATETGTAKGVVIAYDSASGSVTVNITYTNPLLHSSNLEYNELEGAITYQVRSSDSINTIDTWFKQIGSYPSNADIWWIFKDETDTFNPSATIANKGLPSAWAPKGHYILPAFNEDRAAAANTAAQFGNVIAGLTTITTNKRPRLGTFFQGRVWYTGVDDSQQKTGDQNFFTWTENIYFSRIIEGVDDFGKCHEDNDPTDQYSFNLLPSDGGVITIQGAGAVYKLFPVQNGMLVFAANGIWFITGSQGIGFSASDYTITKISGVRSISSNSYVDVNGMPIFWNEEGIYTLSPAQQGLGLQVTPLTVDTIKSFYNDIPIDSKKKARGDYNPIDYIVQWVFQDVVPGSDTTTTYVIPGGLANNGYVVDATTALTGNSQTKVDSFGAINVRHEDLETTYQQWSIPNNTLITPTCGTGRAIHIMENGHVITRHSDTFGNIAQQYLVVSDLNGNVVNQILDPGTGSNLNQRTLMVDYKGTLFGITGEYTGNDSTTSQMWTSRTPAKDTAFTLTAINADDKWDENSMAMSPNYVYVPIDTGSTLTGWTHIRLINWHTMAVSTVVFALPGAVVNVAWDDKNGQAIVLTEDGTIYRYSEDLTTQIAVSTTGLLGTTVRGFNSSKRMCNDGKIFAVNQNGINSLWNMYVIDALFLTILHQYNSRSSSDGFSLGYYPDSEINFQFAIYNAQQNGFFMTGHFSHWDFWFMPKDPVTVTVQDTVKANRILNYNVHTGAFYPWTISSGIINGVNTPTLFDVKFITEPGGITDSVPAMFKYFSLGTLSSTLASASFADCTDETYIDWDYATETFGVQYSSYFITGYSLFGQGLRKFQPEYLQLYSRLNETNMKYSVEGLWDFATNGNSGKWSTRQIAHLDKPNFGMAFKRHKIRGNGYALQLKVSSVDNSPFDIMGWNMQVTQNAGM